MRRAVSQWRELARDYAAEFALRRGDLVRDWLLGVAAIAVVVLDLVALAGLTGGTSWK